MQVTLPPACLQAVLSFVPALERVSSAAWVSPEWRSACCVLALRERAAFQPGTEGSQLHPLLPMSAAVATRVRAAQRQIEPDCPPCAWAEGGHNAAGVSHPEFSASCVGPPVPTFAAADISPARFRKQFSGNTSSELVSDKAPLAVSCCDLFV